MSDYGSLMDAGLAPKPASPYGTLMDDDIDRSRQALAGSLTQAVGVNPDQYNTKRKVAGYLGYPVAALEALPQLADQAKVRQVQADTARTPVLAQRYSDSDFAKLAHDDSGVLSGLETSIAKAARYVVGASPNGGLPQDLYTGVLLRSEEGAAGFFRMAFDVAAAPFNAAGLDKATAIGGNPLQRIADGFGLKAASAAAERERLTPTTGDFLGDAISSGVQSGGQNLKYAPLALLGPAGIAAALTGMVAESGGTTYQGDREKGVPVGTATVHAATDMVAEYTTEKYMGAAGLLQRLSAGAPATKLAMYEITKEVPGEVAATIWQNFNEWALTNPTKSVRDFVLEQPEAIGQTIIATLVGGAVQIGASKATMQVAEQVMGREFETAETGRKAAVLQEQLQAAMDSKLRERSPEEFRALLTRMQEANGDAPSSVYVDAEVLNQLAPEVQALLPGQVLEQMQAALATGDTVAVPLADVLTTAPGTPLEQTFLEHGRIGDPMAPSQFETAAAGKKAGEWLTTQADAVIQQAQDQQAVQESSDRVRQGILDQLTATDRFRGAVNEGYATWTAAFYTTMAGRMGMTPEQMAERYPLRIVGETGAGAALNQSAPTTPAFKAWFGDSKVVDAAGKPLVVYHGTRANIESFGADRANYFTADTVHASGYAEGFDGKPAGANVLPVYLTIHNPKWLPLTESAKLTPADLALLRDEGFDGVFGYRSAWGADGIVSIASDGRRFVTEAIPFNPEQIKSAIGNRGAYDPSDPNILKQSALKPTPEVIELRKRESILKSLLECMA